MRIPIDVNKSNVQLFEILCAMKLSRRSMVFPWVEASILLHIITSLMPFLVDLLISKKLLTVKILPIQRPVALTFVLSLMWIYVDPRRNFIYGTGSLGSVCIIPRAHTIYWSPWNFWCFSRNTSCYHSCLQVYFMTQNTFPLSNVWGWLTLIAMCLK